MSTRLRRIVGAGAAVFGLLAEDAQLLAELASPEQRKHLHVEQTRSPEREALWESDDDYKSWQAQKRREFQEAGRYATPAAHDEMVQAVRS